SRSHHLRSASPPLRSLSHVGTALPSTCTVRRPRAQALLSRAQPLLRVTRPCARARSPLTGAGSPFSHERSASLACAAPPQTAEALRSPWTRLVRAGKPLPHERSGARLHAELAGGG